MMRKIFIPLLFMIMLSTSVLAVWGSSRTITGNDVTITVSPGDGFDVFTITESVKGAIIVDNSFPSNCGLALNKLTCDYEGTVQGTISYKTVGTGEAGGTIDGVNSATFASATKTITGDTKIVPPKTTLQCVKIYEDKDGDGFGNPAAFKETCDVIPAGTVTDNTDCNDNDRKVHPGATELCNNLDDNCDNQVDELFNKMTDNNNCGTCGNVCVTGRICSSGTCVTQQPVLQQPGVSCTQDSQCLSGENCLNQKCSTLLNDIKTILNDNTKVTLQKLSAIASALAKYFST